MLVELLPEFERAIGFDQESRYHSLTVDEHTFEVVQAAADQNRSLAVRLAALFHDLGKPHVAWRGTDGRLHYYAKPGFSDKSHEQVGCELAQSALSRLRYPNALRSRVLRIIRHHMFQIGKGDAAARAAVSREARRRGRVRARRPQGGGLPREAGRRTASRRSRTSRSSNAFGRC